MKLGELEALATQDDQPIAWPINDRNGKAMFSSDGKVRCEMDLLGSESKVYRKESARALKNTVDFLTRKGASDEEINVASSIAVTACAVKGLRGFETDDGKPADCTSKNVKALLAYGFILHQAQLGIGRRAAFFDDEPEPSSTGSEGTSS